MTLPSHYWAPFHKQNWIQCKNVGTVTLEPFSAAEVVEAERLEASDSNEGGMTILHVQQPTEKNSKTAIVIGRFTIKANEYGECTNDYPAYARTNGSQGDEVGTDENAPQLVTGQKGFIILGDKHNGIARVMKTGLGGGGGEKIRFTIVSANTAASPPSAVVTVEARPCDTATVSDESGGQVTVLDRCGCYFDEPDADLVGRCGYACYMQEDGGGCEWQVVALCCAPCVPAE